VLLVAGYRYDDFNRVAEWILGRFATRFMTTMYLLFVGASVTTGVGL
jgi:hypothetical protein